MSGPGASTAQPRLPSRESEKERRSSHSRKYKAVQGVAVRKENPQRERGRAALRVTDF